MAKYYFKGFSTIPSSNNYNVTNRDWTLYDMELVKRDILNHFHTRRGERVMMPTYGCIIWDMLFDQMTDTNLEIIADEAKRICGSDSRVKTQSVKITEVEHGIIVSFTLYFEPWDVYENFSVEFDKRSLESKGV